MQDDKVSLENLGSGAAVELFDAELQKVLANILDPNTKATVGRSVTLTVKIKPDEDREYGSVEIHCTGKMAPVKPFPTNIFIGKSKGEAVAREHNPKQLNAFEEQEAKRKEGVVVDMPMKEETNA